MPPAAAGPPAVIWDAHGTLVLRAVSEQEVGLRALIAGGLSPFGLRAESIERARAYRIDAMLQWRTAEEEAEGFRRVAALLLDGVEPPPTPDQIARVGASFAAYDDVYRPIPGIREILDELLDRGIRQAVVSNWPPSLRRFLDHHDLTRYFSVVVCSAEEGILKPDPELLRRALVHLGVVAAEAVYVGDRLDLDVAPARMLGVPVIHFSPSGLEPDAEARDAASLRAILFARLGLAASVE